MALLSKLSSGWSIRIGHFLSLKSNNNFSVTNDRLPGDISRKLSPSYSTLNLKPNQHSDKIFETKLGVSYPFLNDISFLIALLSKSLMQFIISAFVLFWYSRTTLVTRSFIAVERSEMHSFNILSKSCFSVISDDKLTSSCCNRISEAILLILSKYDICNLSIFCPISL